MAKIAVDSAAPVTQSLIDTVRRGLGTLPYAWGRYLHHFLLEPDEANLLHNNGIGVIPIWNGINISNCRGYNNGVAAARGAVARASALGIPGGTRLWFDIEYDYPVDAAMLNGLVDYMGSTDYLAGVYGSHASQALEDALRQMNKPGYLAGWVAAWIALKNGGLPPLPTGRAFPVLGSLRMVGWQCVGNWGSVDVDVFDETLAGVWEGTMAGQFRDVSPNAWYAPWIAQAVKDGLMEGVSPTTFNPDAPATRAQLAKVAVTTMEAAIKAVQSSPTTGQTTVGASPVPVLLTCQDAKLLLDSVDVNIVPLTETIQNHIGGDPEKAHTIALSTVSLLRAVLKQALPL